MTEEFHPVILDDVMAEVLTNMDETTTEALDREIGPILEQVAELEPGKHNDPAIRQLFNWLIDPQRTVEEFNYAVGPLAKHVHTKIGKCHGQHWFGSVRLYLYLGLEAAEVLAMKNRVLQGPWEHCAWLVLRCNRLGLYDGIPSDLLSDWIIRITGDAKHCPNPFLRLEFIKMFAYKVCGNQGGINADNQKRAIESLLFACSALNSEKIKEFFYDEEDLLSDSIAVAFEHLCKGGYLQAYDQQLSCKLLSLTSLMFKDVSCLYGFNSKSNIHYEINTITALIQTISGYIQLSLHDNPENRTCSDEVLRALLAIITSFKKSCQTPPLVDVTALCIVDAVELVLIDDDPESYISTIDEVLRELCYDKTNANIVATPVGQVIILNYQGRLSKIRQYLRIRNIDISSDEDCLDGIDGVYASNYFSLINSILYNCNFKI